MSDRPASHDDSLDACLGLAFGAEQAMDSEIASQSVLQSLANLMKTVPQVSLQASPEEVAIEPVVKPDAARSLKLDARSRYRIDGEIAEGGMGKILRGRDTDLGRDLAVKVLLDKHIQKPDVIQRFVEEAQIGGQLQHPGIAPVYELGRFEDQRPFFTMKLVKGKTLAALLDARSSVDSDRAKFIGIFEQICQTMAYAHSRGVIHRDLKPANIMVGAFGEVQVMDWGLAKVLRTGGVADESPASEHGHASVIETIRSSGSQTLGDEADGGSQTRAGSVMGTPAYMPPEQAAGEINTLDERADVFGLGAILCEILTGSPPYVGDSGNNILCKAMRTDLDDCHRRLRDSKAGQGLVDLALGCLAAEPEKRLRDAGVIASRINEHIESVARQLKQAELRRKLTYVVAASLLLLVTALGAGGVWLQAKETEAANQVAAAERQRTEEKQAANEELQESVYAAQVQLGGWHIENGRMTEGINALDSLRPQVGAKDLRDFEWYFLKRQCRLPEETGRTDWAEYLGAIPKGSPRAPRRRRCSLSKDGNRILVRWGQPEWTGGPFNFAPKATLYDCQEMQEIWSTEASSRLAQFRVSPDGKQVAIYNIIEGEDKVELVDIATNERKTLPLPENPASPLMGVGETFEYSPTGKYLVSFAQARGALWESLSKATIELFKSEGREVPDPRPAHPGTLVLWDTEAGSIHYQKELPDTTVKASLVFSPDGSRMLTIDAKKTSEPIQFTLNVWDVVSGDLVRAIKLDPDQRPSHQLRMLRIRFNVDDDWFRTVDPAFSNDGSLIAVSGKNSKNADRPVLWIWDVDSGERIFSREVNLGAQMPLTFSSDNEVILDQGGDIFQVRGGKKLASLGEFVNQELLEVQVSVDDQSIEGVTEDGRRVSWKIPALREPDSRHGGLCIVSANGRRMGRLNHREGEGIAIQDHSGNIASLPFPREESSLMYFSEMSDIQDDGRFLALLITDVPTGETTRSTPRALTVWDMRDSSRYATFWRQQDGEELVAARFVPEQGLLLGVIRMSEEGKPEREHLRFWDVVQKTEVHSLDLPRTNSVAFSADGQQLAVVYTEQDGQQRQSYLSIYSIREMKELQRLSIASMPSVGRPVPSRIAFRPDQHEIAVQGKDSIDLWNLKQGTIRQSFSGLHGQEAFGWTADGSRLVTLRQENSLGDSIMTVWNPENGQRLLVQAARCWAKSGHTLKCVPETNKMISWARGTIQYLDGTPEGGATN